MDVTSKKEIGSSSFVYILADFGPLILDKPMSKESFMKLSNRFPDLQMEREKDGKVIIMSPIKPGSGNRESIVNFFITSWWYKHKEGKTFSSATGIELPDGATRSPDCSWISPERLEGISEEDLEATFLKAVPDFIVEVRSQSDSLARLKRKMTNSWMKNGVRLAWLIDPYGEKVYVYRESGDHETIVGFAENTLTGEDVLPGLELPLKELAIGKKKK
jgi:Uma2 family endonuclease